MDGTSAGETLAVRKHGGRFGVAPCGRLGGFPQSLSGTFTKSGVWAQPPNLLFNMLRPDFTGGQLTLQANKVSVLGVAICPCVQRSASTASGRISFLPPR